MGGRRTKVITPDAAAHLVLDGDTLAIGGFVGLAVPEELLIGLANRYHESGGPRDLTLVFAAGQGDGGARGLHHLALRGLIKSAMGRIGVSSLRSARSPTTGGSRRTACRWVWCRSCTGRPRPDGPG